VLLCCESVGGAQRQRRTDTHRDRETERQRGRADTARQRENLRILWIGVSTTAFSLLLRIASHGERVWLEVFVLVFLSFFLSFGSFRFLVVLAAPASFPIGVGFFFCRAQPKSASQVRGGRGGPGRILSSR